MSRAEYFHDRYLQKRKRTGSYLERHLQRRAEEATYLSEKHQKQEEVQTDEGHVAFRGLVDEFLRTASRGPYKWTVT
jgi:hypothetical protein